MLLEHRVTDHAAETPLRHRRATIGLSSTRRVILNPLFVLLHRLLGLEAPTLIPPRSFKIFCVPALSRNARHVHLAGVTA